MQKIEAMLQDKMEKFLTLLQEEPENRPGEQEYYLICRRLWVAPADLDEILEEELGMTGEELLRLPSTFVKFAKFEQ